MATRYDTRHAVWNGGAGFFEPPASAPSWRGCGLRQLRLPAQLLHAPALGALTPRQMRRRPERVIRIFPNRASALRLLGAVLLEQDEQWPSGKRYFDMAAYCQWRETQQAGEVPGAGALSMPSTVSTVDGSGGTGGRARCIS